MGNVSYFLRSLLNSFAPRTCPFCGGKNSKVVDQKYLFTKLLECQNCYLMFRHPKDSKIRNLKFYKNKYRQDGITTDLPGDEELTRLKRTKFRDTVRSIAPVKSLMEILIGDLNGKRLLDFGCSWGYTSWQFRDIGMEVQGYEIGVDRANFGRDKLGLAIAGNTSDIGNEFDVIFSSHVIEHLADIKAFIKLALEKLKVNGYLIILCPNGSQDLRKSSPEIFHRFWGEVHPNFLSNIFYEKQFDQLPFFISSTPFDRNEVKDWTQDNGKTILHGGDELLCIVKKIH